MTVAPRAVNHTIATPANAVTVLRIVLAPVVVAVIYLYAPAWWVLIFGFCAMITDRVDGALARKYGSTDLGTFLDPLADKIMVIGAFVALVALGWVWWLPVAIITAREFAMSAYRSKLARSGVSVPARPLAKWKTWVQSLTVAVALVPTIVDAHRWALTSMLWSSVVLTVVTFVQYIVDGRKKAVAD